MLAIGGDLSSIETKKLTGSVGRYNLDDATIDDTFTARSLILLGVIKTCIRSFHCPMDSL